MLRLFFGLLSRCVSSRRDLLLENLALRQQLAVLKARHPQPRFAAPDKLFWVLLRGLWPGWKQALVLMQPETVVGWHRAGFKLYWKWLSRHRSPGGRRCVSKELRELIFRMVAENQTWGAPRIHGELKMLGFNISERTVLRWMRRAPRHPEPAKRWAAFLSNHREAIAAMDFFTVPTLTFGVLYGFFVIAHDRRRILHFGVTKHPTSSWVSQQLREAFPYDSAAKYLIFDRGSQFNEEVIGYDKDLRHNAEANELPESVAKRSRRTLGRQLLERLAGSCDCLERAPPETSHGRVHPLLPRGSDASRVVQEHSEKPNGDYTYRQCEDHIYAEAGRPASSI